MLVLDYSGVAIASILGFDRKLEGSEDQIGNMIRHIVISTIKSYKKQFKEYSSELVIACDGNAYWRKEIFPQYKFKRKKSREESDIPWDIVYKYLDEVREALELFFPYKVIRVPRAEADDVMAVLAMDVCPQLTTTVGFEESVEKFMGVSSDKDMKQLLRYNHVRLYSPYTKKLAAFDPGVNAKTFTRRLILTGDSGDGIPNVFSPITSFVDGIRQKAATSQRMDPILKSPDLISGTDDPIIKERIRQNARLISFDFIPHDLRVEIVEEYSKDLVGSKMLAYQWMADRNMKLMMNDIEEF